MLEKKKKHVRTDPVVFKVSLPCFHQIHYLWEDRRGQIVHAVLLARNGVLFLTASVQTTFSL